MDPRQIAVELTHTAQRESWGNVGYTSNETPLRRVPFVAGQRIV